MSSTQPVIIPLGCDCFPRIFTTSLGVKKRKQAGERTFPLDFGCWPVEMVEFLIENDFEGMADPKNLMVREGPFGFPILCDRRFPVCSYNHEITPATEIDFIADNFRRFTERYERRIKDFRDTMGRAESALFVMSVTTAIPREMNNTATPRGLHRILLALRQRYPQCQIKMLVVIEQFFSGFAEGWQGGDSDIYVANLPLFGPYTAYYHHYMVPNLVARDVLGTLMRSFP